jgi:hypothetical protein
VGTHLWRIDNFQKKKLHLDINATITTFYFGDIEFVYATSSDEMTAWEPWLVRQIETWKKLKKKVQSSWQVTKKHCNRWLTR